MPKRTSFESFSPKTWWWDTRYLFYILSMSLVIGGPPVTTKPDGEARGFCGDPRPEGFVCQTSRQAIITTSYRTSIRNKNCSYFTQMNSTKTAIDDSNRRRNKIGIGCYREATAPLLLIFKLLFPWWNIDRHSKGITQHTGRSPKK